MLYSFKFARVTQVGLYVFTHHHIGCALPGTVADQVGEHDHGLYSGISDDACQQLCNERQGCLIWQRTVEDDMRCLTYTGGSSDLNGVHPFLAFPAQSCNSYVNKMNVE